jgi:hypothetical protein
VHSNRFVLPKQDQTIPPERPKAYLRSRKENVGAAKDASCLSSSMSNECGHKEEAISGSQSEMGGAEEKGKIASLPFSVRRFFREDLESKAQGLLNATGGIQFQGTSLSIAGPPKLFQTGRDNNPTFGFLTTKALSRRSWQRQNTIREKLR